MSHSSSDPGREAQLHDAMKNLLGEYPDGKLNEQDEGAIAMVVTIDSHRVRLEFPKRVKWVACTADEAAELALEIMRCARKLGLSKSVVLEL